VATLEFLVKTNRSNRGEQEVATDDYRDENIFALLEKKDQPYHMFWYEDKLYMWTSIFFGEGLSPDIAQKVILTHANKCLKDMPLAADIIINSTYLDDTIMTNDTE
jgi:hypothetical protein